MRKIISLICFLLPMLAFAAQREGTPDLRTGLRDDAPDRHVVVKGDTLWDISGKFFKDPWKWPQIWGLNRESIKNPHWIYPGDIIFLDRTNGTLHIGEAVSTAPPTPITGEPVSVTSTTAPSTAVRTNDGTTRLSPRIRTEQSDHDVIPTIPASLIAPFLSRPLVIEEDELEEAPTVIGAREGRVVLGAGDVAFVDGMPRDKGDKWYLYRPGKEFTDPETGEFLGIEAVYLGNSEVSRFADVSTIAITFAKQEIYAGDRLVTPSAEEIATYLPRAPWDDISAQVISIYGGSRQAGQNVIVTLSKGARDGLEIGHVLALYHKGEEITVKNDSLFGWDKDYTLPDERYGLVFVFRVFEKVSYALVMQTKLPVQLLDRAITP
ncbi:MAG TPA: LysM peptidoglycan-binding domain-containing protein [Gallionella sp.]